MSHTRTPHPALRTPHSALRRPHPALAYSLQLSPVPVCPRCLGHGGNHL